MQNFIRVFVFLLLTSIGVTCNAASAPQPVVRFENIMYLDNPIAQFDKDTIKYTKDPYRDELLLDVWIKTIPDAKGNYNMNRYWFRLKEREMMPVIECTLDADGNVVSQKMHTYDVALWKPILPETMIEKWYSATLNYAHTNNKKLKRDLDKRSDSDYEGASTKSAKVKAKAKQS